MSTFRHLCGGWIWCTGVVLACTIVTMMTLQVENLRHAINRGIRTYGGLHADRSYNAEYLGMNYNSKNIPLEAVRDVEYKRNIYFTVKTTASNYQERLSILLLTWFQAVPRDDIAIISDKMRTGKSYADAIKKAGFNLITTSCQTSRERDALCCKGGEEFHSYYKAVENNPSYQWFCHVDDDIYVNVQQLSRLLQKYDPDQPYYIGRWIRGLPSMNLSEKRYARLERKNITIKTDGFQYATGAAYCISHALMAEARKYFDGEEAFCYYVNLFKYGDDITIGLLIHVYLGRHLTNNDYFSNQYDKITATSKSRLKKYITISYKRIENRCVHVLPIENMFAEDQTRFMSFHCLLYPSVSWCKKQ